MIDIKRIITENLSSIEQGNDIPTTILIDSVNDLKSSIFDEEKNATPQLESKIVKYLIECLDSDLSINKECKFKFDMADVADIFDDDKYKQYIEIRDSNSSLEFWWYIQDGYIYLKPKFYRITKKNSGLKSCNWTINFLTRTVSFYLKTEENSTFDIKISVVSGLENITIFEKVINVVDDGVFEAMNRLSIDECFEKTKELLGETIYNLDIKIKNDMPIGMVSSVGSASNMIKLHKGSLQAFCIETPFESIRINSKQYHYINEGISFCSSWFRRLKMGGAIITYREDENGKIGIEIDGDSNILQLARGKYSFENVKKCIQKIMESMALTYDVKSSKQVKRKEKH